MTFDDIIKYLIDHGNDLGYACVPLGLGYPALRRIIIDRRNDRREDQKDTFTRQLIADCRELRERADKALEDRAKLSGQLVTYVTELTELRQEIEKLRQTNAELKRDIQEYRNEEHTERRDNPSTHRRGQRQ